MADLRKFIYYPMRKPLVVQPESPVYVYGYGLAVQKYGDAAFVQVRLVNRTEKQIHSVFLHISGRDFAGNSLYELKYVPLVDCMGEPHKDFGEEQPLFLPRGAVHSVEIRVLDVLFADGMIWRAQSSDRLLTLEEAGWITCACGMKNPGESQRCVFCGANISGTDEPVEITEILPVEEVEDLPEGEQLPTSAEEIVEEVAAVAEESLSDEEESTAEEEPPAETETEEIPTEEEIPVEAAELSADEEEILGILKEVASETEEQAPIEDSAEDPEKDELVQLLAPIWDSADQFLSLDDEGDFAEEDEQSPMRAETSEEAPAEETENAEEDTPTESVEESAENVPAETEEPAQTVAEESAQEETPEPDPEQTPPAEVKIPEYMQETSVLLQEIRRRINAQENGEEYLALRQMAAPEPEEPTEKPKGKERSRGILFWVIMTILLIVLGGAAFLTVLYLKGYFG